MIAFRPVVQMAWGRILFPAAKSEKRPLQGLSSSHLTSFSWYVHLSLLYYQPEQPPTSFAGGQQDPNCNSFFSVVRSVCGTAAPFSFSKSLSLWHFMLDSASEWARFSSHFPVQSQSSAYSLVGAGTAAQGWHRRQSKNGGYFEEEVFLRSSLCYLWR